MKTPAAVGGRCRYCRCTPDNPCRLPGGGECGFLDRAGTVCNAPGCALAGYAELEREAGTQRRKMRELMHKRKRNGRRP